MINFGDLFVLKGAKGKDESDGAMKTPPRDVIRKNSEKENTLNSKLESEPKLSNLC